MSLVSASAASGARTKSSTASEVAAYTARLQLLQVALHQSAKAVTSSSSNAAAKDDGQSDRGGKLCGPRPCLMLAVIAALLIACTAGEGPDDMARFRTAETLSCFDFMHCKQA